MKKLVMLVMVLGVFTLVAGCGGGGDSDDPSYNITGDWLGTVEWQSETNTVEFDIVQTNTTLSGVSTNITMGGTHSYTGSISGSSVYLVEIVGNSKREYHMTLTSANTMTGTYTFTDVSTSDSTSGPATFTKTS